MTTKNQYGKISINDKELILENKNIKQIYDLTLFKDIDIEHLINNKCNGCKNIYFDGFNSNNRMWCKYSRNIASMEYTRIMK